MESSTQVTYVAYYRVSTKKQGESGLGLEAQQAGIRAYCRGESGASPGEATGRILAGEFTDVDSASKHARKGLLAAIDYCQKHGCTLIAYRLDRLTRTLEGLIRLRESKISFTSLDCLYDTPLLLDVKTAFAADELRKISERTKNALTALKARGVGLGDNGENLARTNATRTSVRVRQRACRESLANKQATELILLYRERGYSWREVADKLNFNGYRTRTGKEFSATACLRLYQRFESDKELNVPVVDLAAGAVQMLSVRGTPAQ